MNSNNNKNKVIKKGQIITGGELYSIIRIPRYTYHDGSKPTKINRIYKSCNVCNGWIGFQIVVATTTSKEQALALIKYYNRYSNEYYYMYSRNPHVIVYE